MDLGCWDFGGGFGFGWEYVYGYDSEDGNGNKDGNTNKQIKIGIGLQLTRTLLQRENTIVIATKRALSTDSSELEGLSKAQGSRLIIVTLASDIGDGKEKENTVDDLVERLKNEGVEKIDTLILNAGAATSFESVKETSVQELQAHFQINTVWPIRIYQVLRPLLLASSASVSGEEKRIPKKVIYISSYLGSIGGMEDKTPSLAYGISKAAGNYFVRKLHFEEGSGVVCVAVHPGWVKTDNGQAFADSLGVKEPPMSLEESVSGVMRQMEDGWDMREF
ncbi:hypothetical protein BCON_0192g00170 [Botryotinia convoluta]|uniref:NAD(P)-binding protein n=1 Tax=Botryotinia convoluta TaxID=54673 RepID=A0A4Z1HTS5_9HELO|nr:hypothetical protein BCON_0192g00170 [Botryotinia convoluta]